MKKDLYTVYPRMSALAHTAEAQDKVQAVFEEYCSSLRFELMNGQTHRKTGSPQPSSTADVAPTL